MKLFIIGPDHRGDGIYHLLTETGEHLASHWCSHIGFAKGDLEANRPERKAKWKERFGEYTVQHLSEQTEISLKELQKRNKEWYDSLPKEEKNEENPDNRASSTSS